MEPERFGDQQAADNEQNAQAQNVEDAGGDAQGAENAQNNQSGPDLKHTKKCASKDGAECDCGAAEKAAKAAEKAAAKAAAEAAKNAEQESAHVPAKRRVLVVDEPVERWIQVRHSSVTFRPGEVLTDPHKIRLAEEHGILTRER